MGHPLIVEVVAVGTELLIGQIVNSNAAAIGQRLADSGIDAHYQTTVGDNIERLTNAIRIAAGRSDAVILTGGIGPTQDDLTREALCAFAGRRMKRDDSHAASIRQRLMNTRGSVSDNTLRMADHPDGAETLPNPKGVALGVALEHDGTWFFAMPGVPREMLVMLDDEVMPRLRSLSGEPSVLKSRVVRTWGYGESQISELLDDLYQSTNPSVAFLINASEVRIRISAKGSSETVADSMIERVQTVIDERLGDAVFGHDDDTVEVLVVRMLAEAQWKLATVETSTHGIVATRITQTPGGAGVFAGSRILPERTTMSDAEASAVELLVHAPTDADVVVAVSEIAGTLDGANSTRRVGLAVRTPQSTTTRTIRLLGDDERARTFAVTGALHAIRLALMDDRHTNA